METINLRIQGTTALMLNSPRTANPFDEYSKLLAPLTSKRKKTEEDLLEISRIKFLASLYINDGRYVLPAQNIEQSIIEAARERKLGKKFERSFHIYQTPDLHFPDEGKTPQQLYDLAKYVDVRVVGIKDNKITTTRAIFPSWWVEVQCDYDETQINRDEVLQCAQIAGLRYGVGTYRRMYGRYSVEEI